MLSTAMAESDSAERAEEFSKIEVIKVFINFSDE